MLKLSNTSLSLLSGNSQSYEQESRCQWTCVDLSSVPLKLSTSSKIILIFSRLLRLRGNQRALFVNSVLSHPRVIHASHAELRQSK